VTLSATVDTHDVERAVRRAATLRRASVRALPTVAGEETTPAARERIRADHVVLFRDGGVTGWEDALAAWAA
jgi:hypothetical protein